MSKTNKKLGLLLKLLLEFGYVKNIDKRIAALSAEINLPPISRVWHSPQEEWLDSENCLRVGLYWSTAKEGERAHYEQFPEIFINGKNVNDFYKNFNGYKDRSNDPKYSKILSKYKAEKVLVKEFPKTGRKVEIYLYSNLEKIKSSPHPITISRGHAGEEGNTDYPGIPGGLRIASHCRSINDADSLIEANAQSAVISITGTGKAVETNPMLYYLLEYLGDRQKWGNWAEIKEFIRPHIPGSITKYSFPAEDISSLFAVMLKAEDQAPDSGTVSMLFSDISKIMAGILIAEEQKNAVRAQSVNSENIHHQMNINCSQ